MSYDYRYAKKWRLDRERGITRYVDPEPARCHIQELLALGVSKRAIAQAAGVSPTTITDLTKHNPKHVTRRIAAKILAATPAGLHQREGDDFVPRIGVLRRLQALQALGHSAATIAAAAGVGTAVIHNLVNQRGPYVSAMNRDRVHAAYALLWDKPGRSQKVATMARTKGWVVPMAWDDIDDPTATPDLGEPDDTRAVVHIDDLEHLLTFDPLATAQNLADRLGVTKDAIQQACRRHERQDLLDLLARNADLAHPGRGNTNRRTAA